MGESMSHMGRTLEERFWSKVRKGDGCWLWTSGHNGLGYGKFWFGKGCYRYAHHVGLELSGRTIPAGMNVLHSCDNPRCVRPDHLFIGTKKDNTQDAKKKGRLSSGKQHGARIKNQVFGQRNGRAKLRDSEVVQIRHLAAITSRVDLAVRFRVSAHTIKRILNGSGWKRV